MAAARPLSWDYRRVEAQLVRHLVSQRAVNNTVVVSFTSHNTLQFALNWAAHLSAAGVRGLLVGFLQARPGGRPLLELAARLKPFGAVPYAAISPQAGASSQGGRWFHVLPLLRTGARVLLSDVDVVWLRDPVPYLRLLEAAHPSMDMAVSTDAQGPTDLRPLGGTPGTAYLDIEAHAACHASMNIGVLAFAPGARPGALRAIREVEAHLSLPGNLRRVDQGPINHRWKRGAAGWAWPRALHARQDGSGWRLCGLCNGSVTAGVLPLALFGNFLTARVLRLHALARVAPLALHATFLRKQVISP